MEAFCLALDWQNLTGVPSRSRRTWRGQHLAVGA